jgi:hypothetical protein
MAHCTGQPRQSWFTDGHYIKLADRSKCLAAYGNFDEKAREQARLGKPLPGFIAILEPCEFGRISQNWTFTGEYHTAAQW